MTELAREEHLALVTPQLAIALVVVTCFHSVGTGDIVSSLLPRGGSILVEEGTCLGAAGRDEDV